MRSNGMLCWEVGDEKEVKIQYNKKQVKKINIKIEFHNHICIITAVKFRILIQFSQFYCIILSRRVKPLWLLSISINKCYYRMELMLKNWFFYAAMRWKKFNGLFWCDREIYSSCSMKIVISKVYEYFVYILESGHKNVECF